MRRLAKAGEDADALAAAGFGGMLSKSAVLDYATGPRVRPLMMRAKEAS